MFTLYGDKVSGNCLKVKFVADHLGLAYRWIDVDVVKGEAKSPEFLAKFPMGQVPALELADGHRLAQSNAMMLFLARGSSLIPADELEQAEMLQWLFWEQYSHEPAIAVRRFQKFYLGKPDSEIDPALMRKGRAALDVMAGHLAGRDWFVGKGFSCADIGLVAYTRVAHEGGFDLAEWPVVRAWVQRVERALGLAA
ncbi:glutathione S-transferase [Sandarakinorhabdus cyanobacteriorum]|uniref:Glutathione S-transferase n=1 Tax=Sandarakinorhabdus cyanobacteriorum TaxID=1981098 RepID=A0A255Z4F1_9SPHN|nr:glutathione S-transferase family protein [Sandarakinorhabdus cyanobacteriorum]OYQ36312.1 glutathione S-transferase [Sandarakinorhabdus cyanobacteriorum]